MKSKLIILFKRYHAFLLSSVSIIVLLLNAYALYSRSTTNNEMPSGQEIVDYAMCYVSNENGLNNKKLLDCSGFTRSVYAHFNINIPPSSRDQIKLINCTDIELLGPGDLIFFKTNGKTISHVGIYMCENKFIHSPGKYNKVRIDSITHEYWHKRYICGGALKNKL